MYTDKEFVKHVFRNPRRKRILLNIFERSHHIVASDKIAERNLVVAYFSSRSVCVQKIDYINGIVQVAIR